MTAASVAQPDLAVTKTVDKSTAAVGDYVVFTVTVVNEGDSPATSSTINDLTPAGMTFLIASFVDGSYNESTGDWMPSELDVFDEAKLVFVARIDPGTAGTSITNGATVVDVSPMDSNPANDSAEAVVMVIPPPPPDGIFFFLTPSIIPNLTGGAFADYSISVINSSTNPAEGTTVTVIYGDGLLHETGTSSMGIDGTLNQVNTQQVAYLLGFIPAFTSVSIQNTFSVDPNEPPGNRIINVAVDTATTSDSDAITVQIKPEPFSALNFLSQITLFDPVGTFAGNFVESEPADLNLGGPLPVFLQRYYDSALFADDVVKSALGHNWQHNWEITLSITDTNATVGFRRGRVISFQHDGTNWNQVYNTQVGFRLVDLGAELMLGDPRSQLMYFFDGSGLLTRVEDGRGNTNSLSYTGNLLASVTDGLNRTLNFSYDSSGLLTNVTDGVRSVSYTHTSTNLTSFTDVNGQVTTYSYDPVNTNNPGLMTARTLPQGNTPVTQVFNAEGRVIFQTDAAGNTNSLAYAIQLGNKVTTMTDPLGNSMTHTYRPTGELNELVDEAGEFVLVTTDDDGRRSQVRDRNNQPTLLTYDTTSGLPTRINHPANNDDVLAYTPRTVNGVEFPDLTRITRPDNRQDNFVYDTQGNLIRLTNRADEVWSMGRNPRGQLLTSTNPTGGVASFTYDTNARLSTATDSDLGLTTFTYDGLNRLTGVTNADASTSAFEYDPLNRVTSVTDERGNTFRFEYDDNSRLTGTTNALNQETRYEYDGLDQLTRSEDRLGHAATFGYDPRNAPRSLMANATNRNGFVTRYHYDARRRLTGVVDPAGRTNAFEYDSEGLLIAGRNPLGETVTIERDAMGYPTSFTDPLDNEVTLVRDSMKRVTQVTDPLGRIASYSYEARGLLSSASREPDIEADYNYDALGNLEQIIDPNNRFWRFTHTPMGRVTSSSDPLGRTNFFTYDNRGRLSSMSHPDGATQTNTHDAVNNLTRVQYSDGTDLQFEYDALNRLTNATESEPISFDYDAMDRVVNTRQVGIDFGAAYDADGRLTNVTYNSGQFAVTYTYDSRDRLTGVSDDLTGTSLTFTYDDAHRLTGVTRPNGVNGTYTYDARGLITRIQEGSVLDLQYAYDAAGQVTEADYVTAPIDPATAATTGSTEFFYDSASQISATIGYGHDQRGRQDSLNGAAITWDDASRLRSFDGVTFTYNALNDLETRVESGNTNRYFYNYAVELNPIMAERNENGGQFTRVHVWSPGGLLLYIINLPGNTVSFPLFDRVGSTLALTDGAGAVTDAYAYNAYGRLLSQSGSSSQPFRFNGAYGVRADDALYHMRARWYDPHSARFLSKEPLWPVLEKPKMINPYQFGINDPLRFLDPSGTLPSLEQPTVPGAGVSAELRAFLMGMGILFEKMLETDRYEGGNERTIGNREESPFFEGGGWGHVNGYRASMEREYYAFVESRRQQAAVASGSADSGELVFKPWSRRSIWPKPRFVIEYGDFAGGVVNLFPEGGSLSITPDGRLTHLTSHLPVVAEYGDWSTQRPSMVQSPSPRSQSGSVRKLVFGPSGNLVEQTSDSATGTFFVLPFGDDNLPYDKEMGIMIGIRQP